MSISRRLADRILRASGLARFPVRVRSGLAEGAVWSLYPWSAYWRGTHEPAVQARIMDLWDWNGKQVWDLGAHYGLFSVGLGRRVGPHGGVAAFEPNPVARERLVLHVVRNRLAWIRIFPFAVSDRVSEERFLSYGGFESTTGHLLYTDETWNPSIPTISVSTVRLDDLVEAGELRLPDFVKLDVEGHGHHAVAGGIKAIESAKPVVLAGLHTREEAGGVIAHLQPLGYEWSRIDGGPSGIPDDLVMTDVLFVPPGREIRPAPAARG